jgi:hypothetical protein
MVSNKKVAKRMVLHTNIFCFSLIDGPTKHDGRCLLEGKGRELGRCITST